MATPQKKLRVAIIGGGVGGVIAALVLSKVPHIEVTVYEAAKAFGEIGVSIGMPWRPWTVLKLLDLQKYLTPLLLPEEIPREEIVPTVVYRKSNQAEGVPIFTAMGLAGYTRFKRSDFHAVLLKEMDPSTETYTSKRLVDYTEPANLEDPIQLTFQDGTTAECDILIGADGIKSVVRAKMYNTAADKAEKAGNTEEAEKLRYHVKARFSGVEVFRALIPADKLKKDSPNHPAFRCPTQFLGKEQHLMSYPIDKGRLINCGIYLCDYSREGEDYPEPWVNEVTSDHLASLYPGWEPDAAVLLRNLEPVVFRWAICVVRNLPFYNSSRVVLLGDSAHAMTNFQGAGAGQAIEDAYILSTILSHPLVNRENIVQALQIYSDVRRPFSQFVLESSRRTGIDCALHDEEAAKDLPSLGKRMQEEMEWAATLQPEDEKNKAIKLVEKAFGAKA